MNYRLSTTTPQQWDTFVAAHPRAHVLQQSAWGELKAAYGWQHELITLIDEANNIVAGAQLLYRRLPFRLGTMAYLAMGPLVVVDDLPPLSLYTGRGERQPELVAMVGANGGGVPASPAPEQQLWAAIDANARHHRAAFLKWEPGIYPDSFPPTASTQPNLQTVSNSALSTQHSVLDTRYSALSPAFRPSPQTVQPPRTILIDISNDEDTILARMNQGTRRKIRQSLKNGISYREGGKADVAIFTGMMNTTGERNEFGVHEPAYYEKAYDLFVPQGDAALILAEHEGDPLAGIMVFAKGTRAWYLYGASSNLKRNLMAAYGVQWAAIQWAKRKGCTSYDMWGIPDEDEDMLEAQFESRSDGLWGVYGFKRGWGGQVVRSLGAFDKVYNSLIYAAYQLAVRVRR